MKNRKTVLTKLESARQINEMILEHSYETIQDEGYTRCHVDIMDSLLTDLINTINKEEDEF